MSDELRSIGDWHEEYPGLFRNKEWLAMDHQQGRGIGVEYLDANIHATTIPAELAAELLRRLGWTVTPPEGK